MLLYDNGKTTFCSPCNYFGPPRECYFLSKKKKKQKQTVVMSYARVTITFNLLEGEK